MVELTVLAGNKAGTQAVARRFPFRVGRAAAADLCLEDTGVFEQHLEIHWAHPEGFVLTVPPPAMAAVNGHAVQQARLRNGDVIDLGSARLRFGFSAVRHRSLTCRELLTWLAFAALCLGQVVLIYWLD